MVQAFARFVLGLSHASLAAFYDQGFKVDETTDMARPQEPLDYRALMEEAFGYLDEAITIAGSADFTLPFEWMQAEVTSQDLVRIARSYKARFRAQVARTPTERAEVNWNAVIADAEAGIQSDFNIFMDWNAGWYNGFLDYATDTGWNSLSYFMYGMADQSGNIQEWLDMYHWEKSHHFPDGRPVLIITPDTRFPQGTTVEEQRAASGRYFRIMNAEEEGNTWKRPDRGPWRWSWYKAGPRGQDYYVEKVFSQPEITLAEIRLLKAEGLYRNGDLAGAAAIINETRTAAGLAPTDGSGTNPDCVPKLPDGSCGDLWEMLKWEKRMEVVWTGLAGANWWFDGRGWGDLWKDSPLQYPIPCQEMHALQLPCNTYGGPGGKMGSAGSTYRYPGEG